MADLGRFQRGDIARLPAPVTGLPEGVPTATITDPNSTVVGTFEVPLVKLPTTFALDFGVGALATLGTYRVDYAATIGGVPWSASDTFDLVAGGDSGGRVISLNTFDRPEASYVLAQLSSGKLVQGLNPHLD